MNIVVTGGCGFVGAHQVVALLGAGHNVCIVDDLSNSSVDVIDGIRKISGADCRFEEFNVLDTARLERTMIGFEAEAVIHLAGLKHVWESTKHPVEYFHTNLGGIGSVLAACKASDVRKLIFSSSGSIYGSTDQLPIVETQRPAPTNPYSVSKSMCETMLEDVCRYESGWSITALRYFNPAGAHPSGLIGENPIGQPSNLLPALVRSATSANPVAVVHGNDFDTIDGSGVRDYVHVMDVAESHLRALEAMQNSSNGDSNDDDNDDDNGNGRDGLGFVALNIGRGEGVSVYQMIEAVERAAQREFEIVVGPPRPGDVAALYGDTTKSTNVLGPIDYRSLEEICDDAWRWESKHEAARS